MMNAFRALGDIITNEKKKRYIENQEFLVFLRELVETLPAEACNRFNNFPVVIIKEDNKQQQLFIELTVSDYLFWKDKAENTDLRFEETITQIKNRMLEKLTKVAEMNKLEPKERKELLAILLDAKKETK